MYYLLVIAIPFIAGIFYKSYEYFNRLSINRNMKDFVYNFVIYALENNDFNNYKPIDYRRLEVNPKVDGSFDVDIDVFVAENEDKLKTTATELFVNIKGNITDQDVFTLYSFDINHSFDYNQIIPESVDQLNKLGLGLIGKFREFVTSKFFKYEHGYSDDRQECTYANKQGLCSVPAVKDLESDRNFINEVDEQIYGKIDNKMYSNHDNEVYYRKKNDKAYTCELNIPDNSEFPIQSALNLKCRENYENTRNPYVVRADYKAKDNLDLVKKDYF